MLDKKFTRDGKVTISSTEISEVTALSNVMNTLCLASQQYPMDRIGNCDFTFMAGEKQLRHRVRFNTTEPKKKSWLDGKSLLDLFIWLEWNKIWIICYLESCWIELMFEFRSPRQNFMLTFSWSSCVKLRVIYFPKIWISASICSHWLTLFHICPLPISKLVSK